VIIAFFLVMMVASILCGQRLALPVHATYGIRGTERNFLLAADNIFQIISPSVSMRRRIINGPAYHGNGGSAWAAPALFGLLGLSGYRYLPALVRVKREL
jgi:hypothetical protein